MSKPEMASPRGRRPANILNLEKLLPQSSFALRKWDICFKTKKTNCKGPLISDVIPENYVVLVKSL